MNHCELDTIVLPVYFCPFLKSFNYEKGRIHAADGRVDRDPSGKCVVHKSGRFWWND
jgi:hypothetical protein